MTTKHIENVRKTGAEIVEWDSHRGAYDMVCEYAILDHPKRGRILISEGFGGLDDIRGGCYRWEHGWVCQLQAEDTLESLNSERWNDHMSLWDALSVGCDPSRPLISTTWPVYMISNMARGAGLSSSC